MTVNRRRWSISEPKKFEDYTPDEIRQMNLENALRQAKLNLEYDLEMASRRTGPVTSYRREISCVRCGLIYGWTWTDGDKRELSANWQPLFAKLRKHSNPLKGHYLRFIEKKRVIQAPLPPQFLPPHHPPEPTS